MEIQNPHGVWLNDPANLEVIRKIFGVIDVQLLIVLLASHDKDALHLGVCGPFRVSIIANVVDHAVSNLIKILLNAVLFLAADALHDEVFLTINYDQRQESLLSVYFDPEVSADVVEEVDPSAKSVACSTGFSLCPNLHVHDV